MSRLVLLTAIALAGGSTAAIAQSDPAPAASAPAPSAPATNSGVLRRVPLDQWMPERCPNPERQGEVVVCGRPDEEPAVEAPPPEPGERGTDVQSERLELVAPESAAPSAVCTAAGPAGNAGCSQSEYDQWRRERTLQKAREKVPERR